MKIECILHREGGTKVNLDGLNYHFAPQSDGRHIAEVDNEDHIGVLLSIPEGYRIAKGASSATHPKEPAKTVAPKPVTPATPVKTHPETPAPGSDGPSGGEGGSTTDNPPNEGENGGGNGSATEPTDELDEMDRDDLVKRYAETFGTQPPPNVRKKAIIAALREKAST